MIYMGFRFKEEGQCRHTKRGTHNRTVNAKRTPPTRMEEHRFH